MNLQRTQSPYCCGRRRAGSAYLFALSTSLLVVVAGVTAVRLSGITVKTQRVFADGDRATREATAAMEAVTQMIASDPSGIYWREAEAFDSTVAGYTGVNNALVSLQIVDPVDNEINFDPTDVIQVNVTATVGEVRRVRSFQLQPLLTLAKCLDYTLVSQAVLEKSGKQLYLTGTQTTINASDILTPALIDEPFASASTGIDYRTLALTGTAVTDPAQLFLPTFDSLLAAYRAAGGTEVTLSANTLLSKQVFSPASNPLGPVNPRGIYIIDAGGRTLSFSDCRIVGTLVIHNHAPSTNLLFDRSMFAEPATAGLPTLVMQGDIDMTLEKIDLSELAQNINFNPAGAAYLGQSDSDTSDIYPSMIRGLIYVDGDLNVIKNCTIQGQLFVTGEINVLEDLILRKDRIETTTPPPGFAFPSAMQLVAGSISGN